MSSEKKIRKRQKKQHKAIDRLGDELFPETHPIDRAVELSKAAAHKVSELLHHKAEAKESEKEEKQDTRD